MATLLLVDGHAYAYRAFHAIRRLNGPDGRPTNAIFGFIKMLARLRATVAPSHVAVIWDGGLSDERMALLPGYKAQRPAMPDALADQIEEIGEYLQGAGIPSLCREGVEADDLIASLARAAERESMRVVIASSDKDFFQLVSPSIGLLNPADKTDQVWAAVQVREKTGVDPAQIVDWLSLIGDAVDNIPGVAGVGPKTAAELLNRFGSVAKVYERLDEIASDRLRAALAHAAADVRRNQEMIRLRDSLPGAASVDGLAPTAVNEDRLLALFRRWGFKGMAAELEPTGAGRQADLFAPTGPAQAQESLDRN